MVILNLGLMAAASIPFIMNVGAKTGKFYGKYGGQPLLKAGQFGLGYGASTAIGYNLIPQFGSKSYKTSPSTLNVQSMPYGQRKIRVWSTRYRRYIYVYPRNSYRSSYTRRRPSYRRRY